MDEKSIFVSLAVIQFLFNILNYLKVLLILKNRSSNYNGDGDTTRYGTVFIKNLIQEIRSHGNVIIENDTKMVLLNAANKVEEELLDNSDTFFTCLYNCINFGRIMLCCTLFVVLYSNICIQIHCFLLILDQSLEVALHELWNSDWIMIQRCLNYGTRNFFLRGL